MSARERGVNTYRMTTSKPDRDSDPPARRAVRLSAGHTHVWVAAQSESEGQRHQNRRESSHQKQLRVAPQGRSDAAASGVIPERWRRPLSWPYGLLKSSTKGVVLGALMGHPTH